MEEEEKKKREKRRLEGRGVVEGEIEGGGNEKEFLPRPQNFGYEDTMGGGESLGVAGEREEWREREGGGTVNVEGQGR